MTRTTSHKWCFATRFRRGAFGWKSALPIQRLKEALAEIRQIARADPVLAADGAVALLEKLSPALEHVDSSSGAIGTAVNRTIDALVPVIAGVDVPAPVRMRWLERLFDALQDDPMPYIERLGDRWGDLCTSPAIASLWADRLLPITARVMGAEGLGEHFAGATACLSALNAARRHEELLALVNGARLNWWGYRQYGVDALIALNRSAEALRYAEASRRLNAPTAAIARKCEAILLSSGMMDEAYRRYAIEANQATTHLATFRAIAKKYPDRSSDSILRDLVASRSFGSDPERHGCGRHVHSRAIAPIGAANSRAGTMLPIARSDEEEGSESSDPSRPFVPFRPCRTRVGIQGNRGVLPPS
ncbi:hypothetical protein OH764_33610 (plasmid) [Burkholderia sp. M6-3]